MHVLHIISGLEGGGAEGALYRLLAHEKLLHPENRHTVVSFTTEGVVGPKILEIDVPLHVLGMPRGRPTVRGLLALYRILRGSPRTSVVQTWMHHADLLGGLVARLAGRRRVVWGVRHSTLDRDSRSLRVIARCCALLSSRVPEAAISCSARAAETHSRFGYKNNFEIVPNGYDLSSLRPRPREASRLRAEWGISDDTPLAGMVARYTPQKDHARLIEAFALLIGRVGERGDSGAEAERRTPEGGDNSAADARLVLVGEGCGHDNAELFSVATRYNVGDRIILASRRSDIAAVMSALDVHVLSSASGEAFPNVVAEAMACGAASVATDVGDAASIVGDAGWIVPPSDTTALAGAMREALQERRLRPQAAAARRKAARERVASNFSLEAMSTGFHRVWKRATRIRLDLLAPSMRGGGAERVLSLIARTIDSERFDVRLVLMQKTGPFLAELPDDLEVHDLRSSRARYAPIRLVRVVRQRKPDVILSTLGYLNLLLAIARPFLPRRTRLVAREANTVTQSNASQTHPRLLDALYRRYYRRFDRVVCQSRAMAADLIDHYRVSPKVTSIIRNPVDVARIREAADAGGLPVATAFRGAPDADSVASAIGEPERSDPRAEYAAGRPPLKLLAVGRLVPQKGFDLLIEALAGTTRAVELTIAGEGPQYGLLKDASARLRGGKSVRLVGFTDNPWRLMAQSDVLVVPSRYEGLPNVVLEAGVLGLPVIAFDCPGGTREIVQDRQNGVLVDCADTEAFARAIDRFDSERFDAEKIRERILRDHRPEIIVDAYARLLDSVAR